MKLNEFALKGCPMCGGKDLERPKIPTVQENSAIPMRDPFIRCVQCEHEFTLELIQDLTDEEWQNEYNLHFPNGEYRAPRKTIYQNDEQFEPANLKRGYVPDPNVMQ